MKSTPTCNCGTWAWDNEQSAWTNNRGHWRLAHDFTCEECGEELPANPEGNDAPEDSGPTVTLTRTWTAEGNLLACSEITEIKQHPVGVRGVMQMMVQANAGQGSRNYHVEELAPRITALAREAWGADWSVPGAEPPVVLLPICENATLRVSAVTSMKRMPNGVVRANVLFPNGVASCYEIEGPVADIRAACAEAGVPCCETDEEVLSCPSCSTKLNLKRAGTCERIGDGLGVARCAACGAKFACRYDGCGKRTLVAIPQQKPEPFVGVDRLADEKPLPPWLVWQFHHVDPQVAKLQQRVAKLQEAAGEREGYITLLHKQKNWRETEPCPVCNGQGRQANCGGTGPVSRVCPYCRGTGLVVRATEEGFAVEMEQREE